MTLECWYYAAGIGSFFVAFGGLIGLAFYAAETRSLRIASQKQVNTAQQQLEAAITPCVLVMRSESSDSVDAPLRLANCGQGVALNLRWKYSGKTQTWMEFPALGPGDTRLAPFLIRDIINNGSIECVFESISGASYSTVSLFSENTNFDFRHQFKRLP